MVSAQPFYTVYIIHWQLHINLKPVLDFILKYITIIIIYCALKVFFRKAWINIERYFNHMYLHAAIKIKTKRKKNIKWS